MRIPAPILRRAIDHLPPFDKWKEDHFKLPIPLYYAEPLTSEPKAIVHKPKEAVLTFIKNYRTEQWELDSINDQKI